MVFDRFTIIQNPASTTAQVANQSIQELRQLYPACDIIVLKTKPGGPAANSNLFEPCATKLGKRTLMIIAGGDGTVNVVLRLLLHDASLLAAARATPILPLWCGNANDLAHMLNGRPRRVGLKPLLDKGNVVAIRPIQCRLRLPDRHEEMHLAASYASFGATAFAAQELERTVRHSPTVRQPAIRFGQEFVMATWSLLKAPTFTISEFGQTKPIFERIFFNGSRFAKIFGTPLRITEERFHTATIEHKNLGAILFHIAGVARGNDATRIVATHDTFLIHDSIWAQFDGEIQRIPDGTNVELTMAKRPFYALSTRL